MMAWVKLYYKEVTWFLQPLSITFSSPPEIVSGAAMSG
jgi:hypothetical protein